MASEVDICNMALRRLGAERITSLADTTKRAKLCNDAYTLVRDRVLRSHPWNFAMRRVTLAKLVTTPEFGFDNEFQLPSDCLRVIRIDDYEPEEINYVVEGDKLLIDEPSVKISYISKVTNTAEYEANFIQVLAWELALELSYGLNQSNTLISEVRGELRMLKADARLYDAQEGKPRQFYKSDWTDERL